MKVAYSPHSLRQIEAIHACIAERNPRAARKVVIHIERLCSKLGEFPGMGRASSQEGVWIIPVVRYPYLTFYSIIAESSEVRILRVRLGARSARPVSRKELDR